jgi:lipoyl(octanoyl) transferase
MSTVAAPAIAQTTVLHAGIMEYQEAWQLQRQTLEGIVEGTTPNTLILLQHPSVYTAGRMTRADERPLDGTPVIDVDRGGKITWHGLGQIVGYPIVKLKNRNDVVGFVREVETALIDVCLQFGIQAERYCERSGVWIRDEKGDRKIAAIGMRVAKGVTMHGFALNVNPDLSAYSKIVPCGISDADVTSMAKELGRDIKIEEVLPLVETKILEALTRVIEQKVI